MSSFALVLVSLDPDLALASPHSENAAFPDSEQSVSILKSPVQRLVWISTREVTGNGTDGGKREELNIGVGHW